MINKKKLGKIIIVYAILIAFVKLIGSFLTGSLGFFSEAMDSLVDIVATLLTYIALKVGDQPADKDHHYGYGKVESFLGVIQIALILILYFIVIVRSILALIQGSIAIENSFSGMILLLVTSCISIFFSRYLVIAGKKEHSLALESQGLNFFSDNIKSFIIVFGLFLVSLGFTLADPIFALCISVVVMVSAIKLGKKGLAEIFDVSPLSEELYNEIMNFIEQYDEIHKCTSLRVRASGNKMFFDTRIFLAGKEHIESFQTLVSNIENYLNEKFKDYQTDIIVHIDPDCLGITDEESRIETDLEGIEKEILELKDDPIINLDVLKDRYKKLEKIEKKFKIVKNDIKKQIKSAEKGSDKYQKLKKLNKEYKKEKDKKKRKKLKEKIQDLEKKVKK